MPLKATAGPSVKCPESNSFSSLEEEMIILSSPLGVSVVSDITGVWIENRKTAALEIRNNIFDLNQFFNIGNARFKF